MFARDPSPPQTDADDAADAEATADDRAGRIISPKAVLAWIKSWGTRDELRSPEIGG